MASAAAGRAPEEPASAAAEGRAPGELASTSAAAVGQENPAFVTCSLCTKEVMGEDYTQHLSDYHVQERCEQCGTTAWGLVGLSEHIESAHHLSCPTEPIDVPAPTEQYTTLVQQQHSNPPVVHVPAPALP